MAELLTSLDVVNQSFKKSMRGYDPAEVDDFLDLVAETLQSYSQRTKEMERDLAAKAGSLAEYDRMKGVLNEALLVAQKSADERVRRAEGEAERIIADAMEKADSICHDAASEAERLREGIVQIRNVRQLYEQEFRGLLAKFDNMLNQAVAGSAVKSAVESITGGRENEEGAVDRTPAYGDYKEDAEADRQELEKAFGVLGVDPKTILGELESERGY